MLNTSAIFSAFPLAEQLDAANAILVPVAGTPLHQLVAASNTRTDMVYKQDTGEVMIDTYSMELAANAKLPGTEVSAHDAAMDEYIKVAARAVQNALTVARNVVQPRINELVELTTMRLKSATPSDLTRVAISTADDCPALFNPAFQKMIGKYENAPVVPVPMSINAEGFTVEDLIGMMTTGIDSLDTEIVAWAGNLSASTIQFVWRTFFTFDDAAANLSFNDRLRLQENFAPIVFLLARHLLENDEILAGQNISLKDYKACLEGYMEQAGRALCSRLNMAELSVKNGVLVRSIQGTTINVNPPVYNQWLESGGDNDILFGMAISADRNFTISSITEKATQYRSAWAKYVALTTSTENVRRFTFLQDQLIICYESILKKPDAEGNVRDANSVADEMKRFKAEVRAIGKEDTADLLALARRLVCRTSFDNTPAELILSKMDEVAKQSPNLAPREAAALATLWYISSWVGEQMLVTNP